MNDFTIASTTNGSKRILALKQNSFPTLQSHLASNRQTNHSSTHYYAINLLHSAIPDLISDMSQFCNDFCLS
jgi:hypothetical protein